MKVRFLDDYVIFRPTWDKKKFCARKTTGFPDEFTYVCNSLREAKRWVRGKSPANNKD